MLIKELRFKTKKYWENSEENRIEFLVWEESIKSNLLSFPHIEQKTFLITIYNFINDCNILLPTISQNEIECINIFFKNISNSKSDDVKNLFYWNNNKITNQMFISKLAKWCIQNNDIRIFIIDFFNLQCTIDSLIERVNAWNTSNDISKDISSEIGNTWIENNDEDSNSDLKEKKWNSINEIEGTIFYKKIFNRFSSLSQDKQLIFLAELRKNTNIDFSDIDFIYWKNIILKKQHIDDLIYFLTVNQEKIDIIGVFNVAEKWELVNLPTGESNDNNVPDKKNEEQKEELINDDLQDNSSVNTKITTDSIDDFLPVFQGEIEKRLLIMNRWKPLTKNQIEKHKIHVWSFAFLFQLHKNTDIFLNMFDDLPVSVKKSQIWSRVLKIMTIKDMNIFLLTYYSNIHK